MNESGYLNPISQERQQGSKKTDGKIDEQKKSNQVEEIENVAALREETHSQLKQHEKKSHSPYSNKEQEKTEVDFDNFDQFQDAPNQPEQKSSSKVQAQKTQPHEQNQRVQSLKPNEHHQSAQIKEKERNQVVQNNPIVQQKPQQPLPNNQKDELPIIPSQNNVQSKQEGLSPQKSQIIQPVPAALAKNTSIIKQAQKQRIGSTFSIFLKYNVEYQKTVSSYRLIIKNVRSELKNKQDAKKDFQDYLINYFQTYIKINREFYQRSFKVHKQQTLVVSTNKLSNIKEELKLGFEGLYDMRKTLTDQMRKLQSHIMTNTFRALSEAFEKYHKKQQIQLKKQEDTIDKYEDSQKQFMKLFIAIEKQFKKGMGGEKSKEDLFVSIVKFINQQTQYRQHLVRYGKTVLDFKKTFVSAEKELFASLQKILNQFKLQSRKVFTANKKEEFCFSENYKNEIKEKNGFTQLCTITDVDYIRSVLQLQNRKEYVALTDEHFEHYLQLPFFDRFVGNKKDLFKGAINKSFPLQAKNQQLIHTISGNLVHFNRETDECKDRFNIRYLNAKVFAQAAVELDEVIKGIVFSDNRTVRVKMQSQDRAQELICYLNEKDQWLDIKK